MYDKFKTFSIQSLEAARTVIHTAKKRGYSYDEALKMLEDYFQEYWKEVAKLKKKHRDKSDHELNIQAYMEANAKQIDVNTFYKTGLKCPSCDSDVWKHTY
jgi:hypothetical protein